MRLEECEAKIDYCYEACDLADDTRLNVKRAIRYRNELKENFPQIRGLSTDAVLELGKKENKLILDKIIVELKKILKKGKRPTKKDIQKIVRNFNIESQ
jgi:Mn-dependent DtxR family transcriptional regulator